MTVVINGTTGITNPNSMTIGNGGGNVATNTAVGASALAANTSGATNVAVGESALPANTTGTDNTAVGRRSGQFNTTGSQNTMLGLQAMALNTTGGSNTAVGVSALQSNTTASNNTAVGYQAAYTNATTQAITAMGYKAAYTLDNANANNYGEVFIGQQAGWVATTAKDNTLVGARTGNALTTGSSNVALGAATLYNQTTASQNTAVGYQSGYNTTTGGENTTLGYTAGNNIQTGIQNTYLGSQAAGNTSGGHSYNTGVGYQSLYNISSGQYNVAIGKSSGLALTSGQLNAFIGFGAGNAITTGSKNSILGSYSGNSGGLNITTSSNYIVLSDGDGNPRALVNSTGGFWVGTATRQATSNNIFVATTENDWVINSQANTSTAGNAWGNLIRYNAVSPNGTSNIFLRCEDSTAVRFDVRSNGGLANYSANNVNLSDARTKTDIQDAGGYLDKICSIPVRTFKYKDQTDDLLNLGVIAQEVEAVAPELVDVSGFGDTPEDGIPLKAIYQTDLQYALMKCIQELKAELDATKATLATLQGANP